MTEVAVALIGVLGGAGAARFFEYLRDQKKGRETWDNWRRGSYGSILNRIFEYPNVEDKEGWRKAYMHDHARALLCAAPAVSRFLTQPPFDNPPSPGTGGLLVDAGLYDALVDAMREDVVPSERSRRWRRSGRQAKGKDIPMPRDMLREPPDARRR